MESDPEKQVLQRQGMTLKSRTSSESESGWKTDLLSPRVTFFTCLSLAFPRSHFAGFKDH